VYKKPQSETGNKRLREPHKTRSAKRTSATEQKREQRTACSPQKCMQPPKTAPLSPLKLPTPLAHPATADQSDAVLHNLPIETVSQGMPGREGSRCLTRQEQVASYSRALIMTAATATTLRAAVLLRRNTHLNTHAHTHTQLSSPTLPELVPGTGSSVVGAPRLPLWLRLTTPVHATAMWGARWVAWWCGGCGGWMVHLSTRSSLPYWKCLCVFVFVGVCECLCMCVCGCVWVWVGVGVGVGVWVWVCGCGCGCRCVGVGVGVGVGVDVGVGVGVCVCV